MHPSAPMRTHALDDRARLFLRTKLIFPTVAASVLTVHRKMLMRTIITHAPLRTARRMCRLQDPAAWTEVFWPERLSQRFNPFPFPPARSSQAAALPQPAQEHERCISTRLGLSTSSGCKQSVLSGE